MLFFDIGEQGTMVNGKWLMGRLGTGTANGRAAPKAFGVKSPTLRAETTPDRVHGTRLQWQTTDAHRAPLQ